MTHEQWEKLTKSRMTLCGHKIELIADMPQGIIRMHPETYHDIAAVMFRTFSREVSVVNLDSGDDSECKVTN
jgi:hypothetical protein